MRAGLFGGTFNPIHNGHLMVAAQSLESLALDCLTLVPCRTPPHKSPAYLAPAADRLQMIRLALPADDRYHVSDIEIQRRGPSYTIDTINRFQSAIAPGSDLFLIMGMDAFLEIHTWKRYRQVIERTQPVVVTRRKAGARHPDDEVDRMDAYIRTHLLPDYRRLAGQSAWQRSGGACIHLLPTDPVDASSSRVRRRLAAGEPVGDLVPRAVNAYIEQRGLYR
jgi:nicotinate-nucleotide adenylyltransferase